MWWKYYNLLKKPYLAQTPLNTKDELDLFYGREKEIENLNVLLDDKNKKTMLITGNPGVGKTSLINKLFYGEKGYIYVDLSTARQFDDAELTIAESCVEVAIKHYKTKASEIKKRLLSDITNMSGNSFTGKVSPGGMGADLTKITQTLSAPIRNIEIRELIKKSLAIIKKKGEICMILDESDFFDENHSKDLIHLSRRIIEILPPSSILVLINRDITSDLEKSYRNTRSLTRATFNEFHKVKAAWVQGETDIQEVLKKRFASIDFPFPISIEACSFLDELSAGNLRLLLQYVENVLKFGSAYKKPIPLETDYVKEQIFNYFSEIITLTEQEEQVLSFLKTKPTHLSDAAILRIAKRTSLQNITRDLEQRLLLSRNTKKSGVQQIYSLTRLGVIILEDAIID